MRFVIVGGGGYIGYHIGQDLTLKGHSVLLLDISKPDPEWFTPTQKSSPIPYLKGSLLDVSTLENAFDLADCVIHTASYGMSGKEQLDWDRTELINVTGTLNIIKACVKVKVKGLVYTSSFNVVFGGQEIRNGTENLPYFPLHRHVDHYSRTKAIAEQLVLLADGKNGLRTTALRLAGVMGLKEKRHLPRIVDMLWLLKFTYGSRQSLVQFISIENVVQAHVRAGEKLIQNSNLIGGQPFFVSDGPPINNFEYLRPLIEGLGYKFPSLNVPLWIVMSYAKLSVAVFSLLKFPLMPLLTPAEIYKTGVTHYFSNEKAATILGYVPTNPNDLNKVIEYYKGKKLSGGYIYIPRGSNKCGVAEIGYAILAMN